MPSGAERPGESRPPGRPPELAIRPIALARPSAAIPPELAVRPIVFAGRPADTEAVKLFRVLLIAFAVIVGTLANAATGGVHGKPTTSPWRPSQTRRSPPRPRSPRQKRRHSDKSGTAPDFSGCDGRTGLDNAICRHEALLKVKPDNPGLANSLSHLQANLAAHAVKQAAKHAGTHGNSDSHGNPGSHGPSGS